MVPEAYWKEVMRLAHDSKMTEHLDVNKTSIMLLAHFYSPNIRRGVAENCRAFNISQVMGKPNQNIRVAPLRPALVSEESFCRVIVDCVGHPPKIK